MPDNNPLLGKNPNSKATISAKTDMATQDNWPEDFDYIMNQPLPEPTKEVPPPVPVYDDSGIGLGDLAKATGAGALDFFSGVGQLSENITGYGEGLRDFAGAGADSLTESISPAGQAALQRKIVDEDENGNLIIGEGASHIDTWAMKMAQGVGSMIPMMGTGGVVGLGTKALMKATVTRSMLKRGVSEATAKAVAEKAIKIAADTAAVGVGGAGSLGSAANDARQNVLSMDHNWLAQNSDYYKQAVKRLAKDPIFEGNPDSILRAAREETANYASSELSKDPMAIAGTAIAMAGDKLLFGALKGQTGALAGGEGILGATLKGSLGEGVTETLEGGLQKYANNRTSNDVAGTHTNNMSGVLSEGIEGGLIGAGTGGATGAIGGVVQKVANRNSIPDIDMGDLNQDPVEPVNETEAAVNEDLNQAQTDEPVQVKTPAENGPIPTYTTEPQDQAQQASQPVQVENGPIPVNETEAALDKELNQAQDGPIYNEPAATVTTEPGNNQAVNEQPQGLSSYSSEQTTPSEPVNVQDEFAISEREQQAFADIDYLAEHAPEEEAAFIEQMDYAATEEEQNAVLDQLFIAANKHREAAKKEASNQAPVKQDDLPSVNQQGKAHNKTHVERMARRKESVENATTIEEKAKAIAGFEHTAIRHGTNEDTAYIQAEKQKLTDQGYDLSGFKEGDKISLNHNVELQQITPDDTILDGDYVISRVVRPQINKDGKLVKPAIADVKMGTRKPNAQEQADIDAKEARRSEYEAKLSTKPTNKPVAVSKTETPTENKHTEIIAKAEKIYTDLFNRTGKAKGIRNLYRENGFTGKDLETALQVTGHKTKGANEFERELKAKLKGVKSKPLTESNEEIKQRDRNELEVSVIERLKNNAQSFKGNYGGKPMAPAAMDYVDRVIKKRERLSRDDLQEIADTHNLPFNIVHQFTSNNGFSYDAIKEHARNGDQDSIAFIENKPKVGEVNEVSQSEEPTQTPETVQPETDQEPGLEPGTRTGTKPGTETGISATATQEAEQATEITNTTPGKVVQATSEVTAPKGIKLNKFQVRESDHGGKGLAGELNPVVQQSLLSMRDNPNVPKLKDTGTGYTGKNEVEWHDIGKGASARGYTMGDQVIQEVKLPSGLIMTRGLNEDGTVYGSFEGDYEQTVKGQGFKEIEDFTKDFYKDKAPTQEKGTLDKLEDSISQAEKDAWAELRKLMNEQKATFNTGIDPVLVAAFAKASAFTLAKGSVKFAKWVRDALATAKAMGFDDEQIKSLHGYLKETYGAIAANPEKYNISDDIADEMTANKDLRAIKDIDAFVSAQTKQSKSPDKLPSVKSESKATEKPQAESLDPVSGETTENALEDVKRANISKNKPLLIIQCTAAKADSKTNAFDMYQGTGYLSVIRKFGKQKILDNFNVFFLSAEYGLISEDKVISPYNRLLDKPRLNQMVNEKHFNVVAKALMDRTNQNQDTFLVLPKLYRELFEKLVPNIDAKGFSKDARGNGDHNNELKAYINSVLEKQNNEPGAIVRTHEGYSWALKEDVPNFGRDVTAGEMSDRIEELKRHYPNFLFEVLDKKENDKFGESGLGIFYRLKGPKNPNDKPTQLPENNNYSVVDYISPEFGPTKYSIKKDINNRIEQYQVMIGFKPVTNANYNTQDKAVERIERTLKRLNNKTQNTNNTDEVKNNETSPSNDYLDATKLNEFDANRKALAGEKFSHDGKTFWIEESKTGWIVKEDNGTGVFEHGGNLMQGGWSKHLAVDKLLSKIDYKPPTTGENNYDNGSATGKNSNKPTPKRDGQVRANDPQGNNGVHQTDGSSRPGTSGVSSKKNGGKLQDSGIGRSKGTTSQPFHLETDESQKTQASRVAANIAAIKTLRSIQSENRPATDQEKAILATYTGWGALGNVFAKQPNQKYLVDAQKELKQLLTKEEEAGIRGSLATAFYTSKEVVDAMWTAVKAFNVGNGGKFNVLEPTVGSGNFIGYQPKEMRELSNWSATELDPLTGNIARLIYDDANVLVRGFEKAPFKDNSFSLAIGNPPFGSFTINDKTRPHLDGQRIHNYILGKSADLLHENGLAMMVISNGFMDSDHGHQVQLNKTMEFVGAVRLPNNAFKKAGTEVVTDIVVMRKRVKGEAETASDWTDTNGQVNGIRVNKYFENHPENILGNTTMNGSMYSGRESMTVEPVELNSLSLGEQISNRLVDMAKNVDVALTEDAQEAINSDVTLTESELTMNSMMIDNDGNVRKRIADNENGAQVVTVTPETIWNERGYVSQDLAEAFKNNNEEKLTTLLGDIINPKTMRPKGTYGVKPFQLAVDYFYNNYAKDFKDKAKSNPTKQEVLDALNSRTDGDRIGKAKLAVVTGMLKLRDTTTKLLAAERTDASNIEQLRKQLNKEYDHLIGLKKGTKTYIPSIDHSISSMNGDLGIESGLDRVDNQGKVHKEGLFDTRQVYPTKVPDHADSLQDAVTFAIQQEGELKPAKVAELMGTDEETALNDLTSGERPFLMKNYVTGKYEFIDDFLSGNVKEKYENAKLHNDEKATKLLKEAFPKDVSPKQIQPTIRAVWAEPDIFNQFARAIGVMNARTEINSVLGNINLAGAVSRTPTDIGARFTNPHASIIELFNLAANGKTKVIYDNVGDSRVKNEKATKEVNAHINSMVDTFTQWAKSADGVLETLAKNYNEKVNVWAERQWNGSLYLQPQGQRVVDGFALRPTQLNGAMRMVMQNSVLLDHTVGAGKTFTAITGMMERKRLGLSKKPMLVVPNHIIGDFRKDISELYPAAKVLYPGKNDMAATDRAKFLSRVATGDYDIIVIGHSHLKAIPNDEQSERAVIDEQLDALRKAKEEANENAKANGGNTRSVNQIEKSITALNDRLKKIEQRVKEKKDDFGYTFKDLGVDYLVVDEAHEFKNAMYSTANDRVVGMNDPKGSLKSYDLLAKMRHIQDPEKVKNGGVTFMTGTPVSNSLVELYTLLNYLARPQLNDLNIGQYDAFAGSFLQTANAMEYTPQGTIKERTILKGISNGKGLSDLYRQIADVVSLQDLHDLHMKEKGSRFPVPHVKGGGRQINSAPVTDDVREHNDYLIARSEAMENVSDRKAYAKIDNPLWIMSDARKAGLDIRLVDPKAKREEQGKINRSANEIKRIYDEWDHEKGAQVVFSDMGAPAKGSGKRAKDSMAKALETAFSESKAKSVRDDYIAKAHAAEAPYPLTHALEQITNLLNKKAAAEEIDEDALEKADEILKEAQSEAMTADTGFSVYDDLRQVLVEKGIPENEIAFVHEYDNGPDKKAELFSMVNSGEIRVVIGSTPKMGAGTNMQERLVALHHLDAPWKPSSMEQREGRIIRQKNKLFAKDPEGFEVEIIAYTTDGSSDVVMWQILERKAAAINGFRLGNIIDDVNGVDEDVDSYAALKAQSSGNEVYKDKLKAEKELIEAQNELVGVSASVGSAKVTIEEYNHNVELGKRAQKSFDQNLGFENEPGTNKNIEQVKENDDKFESELKAYAKETKAFKDMDPKERKKAKVTKPVKPVKTPFYDLDNSHSKKVKRAISQAQNALDKALKIKINKESTDPLKIQFDEFGEVDLGNGLLLAWNVNKREAKQPATEFNVIGKGNESSPYVDFTSYASDIASSQLIDNLNASNIITAIKYRKTAATRRLTNLKEQYEKAKEIVNNTNIKPIQAKADKAIDVNNWLSTEIDFTDLAESYRRSQSSNRFIDADVVRAVRQSAMPKIKHLEITVRSSFVDDKYNLFYKDFTGSRSTWAIGTNEKGEYVHAKLIREKLGTNEKGEEQYGEPMVQSVEENIHNLSTSNLDAFEEMANNQDTDDDTSFRVGDPDNAPVVSLSKAATESIAASVRVTNGLDSVSVGFKVVQKESDLPKAIQNTAEQDGATGGVQGVLHDGVVYVVADNHKNALEVEETIFHEIVGHFGLRNLMGDYINADLTNIAMALGGVKGVRQLAEKFNIDLTEYQHADNKRIVKGTLTKEQAAARLLDELVAHVAQHPKKNIRKIWIRVIAKIRHWLRKAGWKRVAKYNENDLLELISRARKNINKNAPRIKNTPAKAKQNAINQPAFRRKDPVDRKAQDRELQDDLDNALSAPSLPYKFNGVMDLIGKGMKRIAETKNALAILTLRQLGDVAESKLPQILKYYETVEAMLKKRNVLADKAGSLAKTVRTWAAANKQEAEKLFDVMHRATIAGVDPDQAFSSMQMAVQDRMAYLTDDYNKGKSSIVGLRDAEIDKDSSQYQEMAELQKQLATEGNRLDEWSDLQDEFNKLTPEAKKHYRAMRNEYSKRHDMMEQLLLKQIEKAELDKNTKRRRQKDVQTQFEMQRVQAPYFPLARFGDYWVKVKDKRGSMRFYMYESQKEQQENVRKLKDAGFKPTFGYKIEDSLKMDGASSSFITNLMGGIDEQNMSDGYKNAIKDMAYQLYLQNLPSRSVRKTALHRKATKGFNDDAVRALASNLMRSSNHLARMEFADDLQQQVNEAKKVANNSNDNQVGRYADELVKRHEWVLNPTHSKFAQKATGVGFFYMLGFSSSAAVINASQNFVLGVPVIGSHFGMAKTAKTMLNVAKQVMPYSLNGNLGKSLKGDELRAYKEWHDLGTLQDTQVYNLAGMAENENWDYNSKTEWLMEKSAYLFQKAEVFNREVATLTVYRLAREQGKPHSEAVKVASNLTKDIHFEYTNANRARVMQSPTAKVLTQFKQYSQQITYYLLRNLYQSFKGDTKEQKKMARQQLLGTLATTALIGGVSTMPLSVLYAMANVLNTAFGDNDEPWDAQTEVEEYLSEMFGGNDVLVHGLLGAGVANRISLDDLWIRDPNKDMTGDESWSFYAKQLAGPVFGGVGVSLFKGVSDMMEGNFQRGIERVVPKFLRDPLKTYRYIDEGALSYSGAAYKKQEDFSIGDIIMQAFGFADNDLSLTYENNARKNAYKEEITNRRRNLLAGLYVAYEQHDNQAKTKLMLKISKFNKRYPGIKITADTVRRSFRTKKRYIANSKNGLNISKKLQAELNMD